MKRIFPWKAAILATGGALLLAGCASGGWYGGVDGGAAQLSEKQAATMQKALAGKVPGEPVNCISRSDTDNAIKVSDEIILYRASSKLVYRNDLVGSCSGLANGDDIMVIRQFGTSQQCDGDIIRMVDRMTGMPRGSCSFGKFVPYRSAAG